MGFKMKMHSVSGFFFNKNAQT